MGILAGIGSALFASLQNSFFKKLPHASPAIINWFRFVITLPLLALLITLWGLWSIPSLSFWLVLCGLSLPLELLLSYLYVKAFQYSPQSLVGPLFSLSAVFLLPLGFLILGERPSVLGIIGVLSIALGPFILGWSGKNGHSLNPRVLLGNVFCERGSWYMVASALTASGAVITSKILYRSAPPLLAAFFVLTGLTAILTMVLLFRREAPTRFVHGTMLGMGLLYGVGAILHHVGLSLMLAAYFISLKRFSIVFDVLLGRLIHKEEHFRERLLGALIMVAGLLLIALG